LILIFSQERDLSTNQVIEWIQFFGKKFIRINSSARLVDFTLEISDLSVDFSLNFQQANGKITKVVWSAIEYCWFRRGGIFKDLKLNIEKSKIRTELEKNLKWDYDTIVEFIWHLIRSKPSLGNYFDENRNNKLINLHLASTSGFKIPHTIVSTNKSSVLNFIKKYSNETITKTLKYPISVNDGNQKISGSLTKKLSEENLNIYEELVAPSFMQEMINKKYELRIFFLFETLFSMLIYSQNDPQTKLDFRNYNRSKPNRFVPYKLPENIKMNVLKFIRSSGLNTGSIDIICSDKNEYIFLEVNPSGQFSFVSFHCNYKIEKEIAKILCKNED